MFAVNDQVGQLWFYKRSRGLLRLVFSSIDALYNGLWLGLLTHRTLEKIDEIYYNDSNTYCSPEYNRKGLLGWEQEMIDQYFEPGRHLLLIGAGGGREAYALQKMGFSVDAFECNQKLREFGNRLLVGEDLEPCIRTMDRDVCPEVGSTYDGAIIGWGTYTLILGAKRRIEFLRTVRDSLNDDAKVLLSFFTRDSNAWQLRKTASIGNFIRFLTGRDRLEVGDSLAPNYVHYFTRSELAAELDKAGLELLYYSDKGYGHAVGRRKTTVASKTASSRKT